jgi:hypothetical protein
MEIKKVAVKDQAKTCNKYSVGTARKKGEDPAAGAQRG